LILCILQPIHSMSLALKDPISTGLDDGYVGCYIDSANRDLPVLITGESGPFNQQTCATACSEYVYFGLQSHGQCWCGNAFGRTAEHKKVPDIECGHDRLGRGVRNAIYRVQTVPRGLYDGYIGCYIDSPTPNRDLAVIIDGGSRPFSQQRCAIACSEYVYFGLQNHGACWCGNAFGRTAEHKNVPDIECGYDRLGRAHRNAIYRVQIEQPTLTPTASPITSSPTASPTASPITQSPTVSPTASPWVSIYRCDVKTLRICFEINDNVSPIGKEKILSLIKIFGRMLEFLK